MNSLRLTGILLIVGAILFFSASFMPLSMAVYAESSAEQRLAAIEAAGIVWSIQHLLFATGILATVAGVGLAVAHFHRRSPSAWLYLGLLAFGASALVAVPWLYLRGTDPQGWTAGQHPIWLFMAYTYLTQGGLLFWGMAWLGSGLPRWPGWLLIGGAAFLFIITIITGDMPPFVYYLLTLVAGVALYRRGLKNHSALTGGNPTPIRTSPIR
jgi:hypothetical protein